MSNKQYSKEKSDNCTKFYEKMRFLVVDFYSLKSLKFAQINLSTALKAGEK